MLAGWKESHTSGATVTFWLPDAGDLEVFRGMTARKGNQAGQRFMAVLVEVNDDETPKFELREAKEKKPPIGPLCLLACQWSADETFWGWLIKTHAPPKAIPRSEGDIVKLLRQVCEVQSRKEFDQNDHAALRFKMRIREPYMQYLKTLQKSKS